MYKKKGVDIKGRDHALQKLRREVEKAKRTLSSEYTARLEIKSFYLGKDFSETLTRDKFEEFNMVCYFGQSPDISQYFTISKLCVNEDITSSGDVMECVKFHRQLK